MEEIEICDADGANQQRARIVSKIHDVKRELELLIAEYNKYTELEEKLRPYVKGQPTRKKFYF